LHALDKVREGSVAPLMFLEVRVEALLHGLITKEIIKLLQDSRPLSVAYTVEHRLGLASIANF
jgi:hypothetical protein